MTRVLFFLMFALSYTTVTLHAQTTAKQNLKLFFANIQDVYKAELYSWHPQKEGNFIEETRIVNNKASIALQDVKPGIYTLYIVGNRGLTNAPWVDVVIDTPTQDIQLYWDVANGWYLFQNSLINTNLKENRKQYHNLSKEQTFFESVVENTKNTQDKSAVNKLLQATTVKLETLLKDIDNNTNIWDDYLVVLEDYRKVDSSMHFWDNFPENKPSLFATPLMGHLTNVLGNLLKKEEGVTSAVAEEKLINELIAAIGSSKEGLQYLENWIYKNYNNAQTNELFVKGLAQLLTIEPNNQNWNRDYKQSKEVAKGKAFNFNDFSDDNTTIIKDKKALTLVFVSGSCGYCTDELVLLNKKEDQNILAVSVKLEDDEMKKYLKTTYANIDFVFPEEVEKLKAKYAYRGTPTKYHLKKRDNRWYIQ